MAKYKLRLKRLDFVSPVDTPAQETAKVLLTKRKGADDVEFSAFAPVVKLAETKGDDGEPIGIVFCWAVTEKVADKDYYDLQGDNVVADDDLIRAALDYVKRGAATDQMHDGQRDGFTPFVMPMNAEIASAFFGKQVGTSGLMVGLAPSAEVFGKFKSGEYTGVSIAGIGEREKVASTTGAAASARKGSPNDEELEAHLQDLLSKLSEEDLADIGTLAESMHAEANAPTEKRLRKSRFSTLSDKLAAKGAENPDALAAYIGRKKYGSAEFARLAARGRRKKSLRKMVVLTSVVDGHQHSIDLDDPADWCGDKLCTSPATSEGAEMSHAHAWTFDRTTGAVTIAMDSGHDHVVSEAVPQNVLSMFTLGEQAEQQEDAQRLLSQVLDGGASGNVTVSVAARAISTPTTAEKHGGLTRQEQTMPDAKDTQIADLTKRAERAERIAKMSGAHKTHFDSLTGDDAETFLAKSTAEREAIVQKALEDDKPIWTGEVTKVAVRRRDGELALQLAKQNEANAVALAKREEEIEKAEVAKIAKETLGSLAGSDEVHQLVIRSLRKSGADKAKIDEALTAMKGWNALGVAAGVVNGVNPGASPGPISKSTAMAALTAGLTEFAKKNNLPTSTLWTEGLAKFVETTEGAALKQAYDDAAKQPQN